MAELRQAFKDFMPDEFPSLIVFCRRVAENDVGRAIVKYQSPHPNTGEKLGEVFDLFGGGTSEDEEDRALAILIGAANAGELKYCINDITWDTLDDELDEPDLNRIAKRLSVLLERSEYRVYSILRAVFNADPESGDDADQVFAATYNDLPLNQLTAVAAALSALYCQVLSDDFLAKREQLLDSIALMARRGRPTGVRELRVIIDAIQGTGQHQPQQLLALSWEVFYTDLIFTQLARGEYGLLLRTLPELVDPSLITARRVAFMDMLRRWDREFAAMEELVRVVGSISQQNDMRKFMDIRTVFINNFPVQPQQPNAVQQAIQLILSAVNAAAGGFQDLISTIQAVAQTIQGFSLPALFGSTADDVAVNATNELHGRNLLALLPTRYKLELINRVLSGVAEDEEEQATLKILEVTKQRAVAEFLQLVVGITWERLDSNINGQEHNDLVALFSF